MSQTVSIDKKILTLSVIAAAATIIGGVLHLAMVQRSLSRDPLEGILFLVGGMAQVFWAVPVIKQWGKVWQIIGIVGTAALVLLWFFDRLHILPGMGMPPGGSGNRGFTISGQALPIELSQLVFIGFSIILLAYSRSNGNERIAINKLFTKKLNLILVGILVGLILTGLFVPISSQRGGSPPGGQPNGFSPSMVQTGIVNQTCTLTPSLVGIEDTPQQTEGPYFVDESLERSDIRSDQNTEHVERGIPLHLKIHVYDVKNGACVPLRGAHVDIWHANAFGQYSDIAGTGTLGKTFLRGYQVADDTGQVQFTTIYPGWYDGRAIHIHVKVRTFEGTQKTSEWTSQFYLDDSTNEGIHKQLPYSDHGMPPTKNNDDTIYLGPSTDGTIQSDTGEHLMLHLSRDDSGYVGTFDIGLNASRPK